jgi:protein-S-isoprenylcysteine O-methyltransferase Ste14
MMFIPMTLLIVWRLLDEEKFLLKNPQDYAEYSEKVHSRLLPFVW